MYKRNNNNANAASMRQIKCVTEWPFVCEKLKDLNLSCDNKEVNILLLGETGVGKSTFINAFFNYLTFSTLEEARLDNLNVVIPVQFTVTDENYQQHIVKVGEDGNECSEIGASATQQCRSYVYKIEKNCLRIRLIDTPGVGDTKGIDRDNINFENILSFIGKLKHLNAICILLKTNNSRLTVMFKFCIKQLLSKLDKSAGQNLIFVFTNTRSTFYRPDDTLTSLRKLLNEITEEVPLDRKNIFCTDNESFRFLAALQNNVQFSPSEIDHFSQSWKHSGEECLRMVMYIIGDDKAGLIPYDIKNSISINKARRVIVQLSKPLADIAQLVQDNIRSLEVHQKVLDNSNLDLSKLQENLYIPSINLNIVKLNHPTTVCTSTKCTDVYRVDNMNKWHYRQKCHAPCHLEDVPNKIVGSPKLTNCAAMNNGVCVICSCRFQEHMHIYYETKTVKDKIEDRHTKIQIQSIQCEMDRARDLTLKIKQQLFKLHEEESVIVKTTATFACFLKTNAITSYNDIYEDYLEYLIDREKSLNDAADVNAIRSMEKMLREYIAEKSIIMNALSQTKDNCQMSASDIISCVEDLYSLQINGPKIKELFEAQNSAYEDETKSKSEEYILILRKPEHKKRFQVRPKRGGGSHPQRYNDPLYTCINSDLKQISSNNYFNQGASNTVNVNIFSTCSNKQGCNSNLQNFNRLQQTARPTCSILKPLMEIEVPHPRKFGSGMQERGRGHKNVRHFRRLNKFEESNVNDVNQ